MEAPISLKDLQTRSKYRIDQKDSMTHPENKDAACVTKDVCEDVREEVGYTFCEYSTLP